MLRGCGLNKFWQSWSKERNRIIIFSGVFDPIHKGHIAAAEKASGWFGRKVIFLPEPVPTHKKEASLFKDRLKMLELAINNNTKFLVLESPIDQHRIPETLNWLKNKFGNRQNFGLLIGSDVAYYINAWENVEKLAEYGVDKLIITDRSTSSVHDLPEIKIPGVNVQVMKADNNHMTSSVIRSDFKSYQTSVPSASAHYAVVNKLY